MVTSNFSPEVEIRPFRACAMHPVLIIGTFRSLSRTWLWGRCHVPQNAFLVITITAYQCSLFNVYQNVTVCYDEYGWELYFSPIKYAVPIPISSPKLLPFPCTPLIGRWRNSTLASQNPNPEYLSSVHVVRETNRYGKLGAHVSKGFFFLYFSMFSYFYLNCFFSFFSDMSEW